VLEYFRIKNNNHEFASFPEFKELYKVKKIYSATENVTYLNKYGINYEFISNGINLENIDLKCINCLIYNKPTFGMCGTGIYRKGFDIFVNIAIKYPEYDFIWIGNLQEEFNIILPNNIKVTGFVENIYYYLKNLNALIFTSREDPFPLVILEALYLNKTIVCSEEFKNNIGSFYLIEKFGISCYLPQELTKSYYQIIQIPCDPIWFKYVKTMSLYADIQYRSYFNHYNSKFSLVKLQNFGKYIV
jgi:hypothetical protein